MRTADLNDGRYVNVQDLNDFIVASIGVLDSEEFKPENLLIRGHIYAASEALRKIRSRIMEGVS